MFGFCVLGGGKRGFLVLCKKIKRGLLNTEKLKVMRLVAGALFRLINGKADRQGTKFAKVSLDLKILQRKIEQGPESTTRDKFNAQCVFSACLYFCHLKLEHIFVFKYFKRNRHQ